MANLVFDTFAGANDTDITAHTPDVDVIGGGWAESGTEDSVELDGSGAVKFAGTGRSAWIDVGTANQVVKGNFTAGGADNDIFFVVRSHNNGAVSGVNYTAIIKAGQAQGEANLLIGKRDAGLTILASKEITLNASATYEIEFSAIGSDLSLKVDGLEELTAINSDVATGNYVGFASGGSRADGGLRLYDFQATDASLESQGFTNLGTLKVPSLGVGVTSSNTPLLIKAADLTTAMTSSLKADWGDLRLSSDEAGNTQLPLDIAATDYAWTRLTSVAADTLIYVWGNKPAAVKEIETATYGRNAVWSDYKARWHLESTSPLDSTGNGSNGTSGTAVGAVAGKAGNSLSYDGTTNSHTLCGSAQLFDSTKPCTVAVWVKPDLLSGYHHVVNLASDQAFPFSVLLSDNASYSQITFGIRFDAQFRSGGLTVGAWNYLEIVFDGVSSTAASSYAVRVNGTSQAISAGNNLADKANANSIGSTSNSDLPLNGDIDEVAVKQLVSSPDQSSIEYQNQSANDAWWIAEDAAAGGGITVNPTGVQATASEGSLAVETSANVSPTGVQATASEGSLAVETSANVSPTGVQATASEGSLAVETSANVSPTGVQATASEGNVSVGSGQVVNPTGVQATTALGNASVTGMDGVNITGVQALIEAGDISVTTNATVPTSGVSTTVRLGAVSAGAIINAEPTGVQTTVVLGEVGVRLDTNVPVTGIEAKMQVGGVNVWGIVSTAQTPNWRGNNTAQTPNWKNIGL